MSKKLVSIVVPTYNGERYLKAAIESILSNRSEKFNLEIIVFNNASTDNTAQVLSGFSEFSLRTVTNSTTLDVGSSWTTACLEAKGEYLKLFCDDDLLLKGSLEKELELIETFVDASAVVSRREIVSPNGRVLRSKPNFGLKDGIYDGNILIQKSLRSGTNIFGEPGCVLFRREDLFHALPWNNENPFVIDLELYIRTFAGKRIIVNNSAVMQFRVNSGSTSYSIRKSQSQQYIRLFKVKSYEFGIQGKLSLLKVIIKTKILEFLRGVIYYSLAKFPNL